MGFNSGFKGLKQQN